MKGHAPLQTVAKFADELPRVFARSGDQAVEIDGSDRLEIRTLIDAARRHFPQRAGIEIVDSLEQHSTQSAPRGEKPSGQSVTIGPARHAWMRNQRLGLRRKDELGAG